MRNAPIGDYVPHSRPLTAVRQLNGAVRARGSQTIAVRKPADQTITAPTLLAPVKGSRGSQRVAVRKPADQMMAAPTSDTINDKLPMSELIESIQLKWHECLNIQRTRVGINNRIKAEARSIAYARCKRLRLPLPTKGNDRITDADKELAAIRCYRLIEVLKIIEKHEDDASKELASRAACLPVAPFVGTVKGMSLKMLGAIIGYAGDLNRYPEAGLPARKGYSKLWTRMGVGMYHGKVQRRSRANDVDPVTNLPMLDEDGQPTKEALKMKYSPQRHAEMFVISKQIIGYKEDNSYRDLYDARKAYEIDTLAVKGITVLPSARIPKKQKGGADYMSLGQINMRAHRYIQKRLLRKLWQAWRACKTTPDTLVLCKW